VSELTSRTIDGVFGLLIQRQAWNQIERLCAAADEEETGGILSGRYTAERTTAVVSEATTPPADSQRGRCAFVRGVAGLQGLLRERWSTPERTYYVGEWHYHPAAAVEPSSTDIEQMVRIAKAGNYRCPEPIMVIVGRPADSPSTRPIRVFVFPAGRQIEMRITSLPG
jgi:integrative and conjugative element protein (TIGR02256 family)